MTREELIARLADHEDNFVERKPESVNASDIRQTVVAFANSVPTGREAVLFIGVLDIGYPEGCQNPDSKQKAVRAACASCYPPIVPVCEVLAVDGCAVVAVVIGTSANRPHFAGPAYVRQGSESVAASAQAFDEMVHSRNSKAGAILRLKGETVTAIGLGHKLGTVDRIPGDYKHTEACLVVACDVQSVRLEILGSQRMISEPLDHIQVMQDEEKHRPMLVVSGY